MADDGYDVTVHAATVPALAAKLIELAEALLPTPPAGTPATATGSPAPPLCPIHKRPMAPSTKPGYAWFCKHKAADAGWCTEEIAAHG